MLGVLYGLGLYRGWAMQSLAAVYSPENLAELRGVRRWHIWASPAVAFVQWLGLIASAFGNRVNGERSTIGLAADGRVLSQRILATREDAVSMNRIPRTCSPGASTVNRKSQISDLTDLESLSNPQFQIPTLTSRLMNILLWDTRQLDVSKDFAGGFGVGMYRGPGGPRDAIVRWFYRRDHRPAALLFAHLAAIFARLGHRVKYVVDQPPRGADLYLFNPSLITLDLERQVIARSAGRRAASPRAGGRHDGQHSAAGIRRSRRDGRAGRGRAVALAAGGSPRRGREPRCSWA